MCLLLFKFSFQVAKIINLPSKIWQNKSDLPKITRNDWTLLNWFIVIVQVIYGLSLIVINSSIDSWMKLILEFMFEGWTDEWLDWAINELIWKCNQCFWCRISKGCRISNMCELYLFSGDRKEQFSSDLPISTILAQITGTRARRTVLQPGATESSGKAIKCPSKTTAVIRRCEWVITNRSVPYSIAASR